MRKSLGNKRNVISPAQIDEIKELYRNFVEKDQCKIYDNRFFGYRKVRIDRPLRLNFQATPDRIQRLEEQTAFQKLTESRKKDEKEKETDAEQGRALQESIRKLVASLPPTLVKDRGEFEKMLKSAMKRLGLSLNAPVYNAVLNALAEKDETAPPCLDKQGNLEPDPDLRDYENVPLSEQDLSDSRGQGNSYLDEKVPLTENVRDYFEREVKAFVVDAFIDTSFVDEKDGRIGKIGYEISFTRYFYRYQPPPLLEDLEKEIKTLEKDIVTLLAQVTGSLEIE
jgi:type I restriction enzyme M protein